MILGFVASCQSPNTNPTANSVLLTNIPEPIPYPTATPTITLTPSAEEIRTLIANALVMLYTRPNRQKITKQYPEDIYSEVAVSPSEAIRMRAACRQA
jgi:hypothetical protein